MTVPRLVLLACSFCLATACDGGDVPATDAGLDGAPEPMDAAGDAGSDATIPADGAGDAASQDGAGDAASRDGAPDGDGDAFVRADASAALDLVREGLCTELAWVRCHTPWACGCPDVGPMPDEDACVGAETEACATELPEEILDALTAGRATVHEAALSRCRERMRLAYESCTATLEDLGPTCARIFVDRAALGERCTAGILFCAGGEGRCAGEVCVPLPRRGEPCGFDVPLCAGDLACVGGVCDDARTEGQPCERDGECGSGLVCAGGTCRPMPAALGSRCSRSAECVVGARCVGGVCTASPGAECATDADCASLEVCEFEYESQCVAWRAIGEPCLAEVCVPEGYCRFSGETGAGTCTPRPMLGEPCDSVCAAGAACEGGVCVPLGGLGEPCRARLLGPSDGCEENLACVDGICTWPPGAGAPCADFGECEPGLRCRTDPSTSTDVCGPPASRGERCSAFRFPDECEENDFCDAATETCAPRRGPGEPCEGYDCAIGLDCMLDEATMTFVCRPLPGPGERCTDACVEGAVCTYAPVEGRCAPRVCAEIPGATTSPEPGPLPG